MLKNLQSKFLLLLAMIFMGVGQLWAEDVQVASATFNGKNATYTTGWSTTGTGKGRTDCIIIGYNENITSPSFDLSQYSKVTISIKARRYGQLSDSKATIDVSIGGTSVGSVDATGTSATASLTAIEFTPTSGMTAATLVFTCTNATSAGSSHGAGINNIVITGTPKSDTPPTPASPLSYITLSGNYPTEFSQNGTFSSTGLVVTAYYEDESSNVVTEFDVSEPDLTTLGDQTVTVSYTEGEITKTADYTITVTEYLQPTTVVFQISQSMFEGVEFNSNNQTSSTPISTEVDNVRMTIGKGNSNTYVNDGEFRCYANSSLTFTAPNGYILKSITFTKGSSYGMSGANFGTLSSNKTVWTAENNSQTTAVTFSFSGRCDIRGVTVVLEVASAPSNATFANAGPSINYPATSTYTQAVTTAEGYTGTVSYALSDNTCGATIEGATVTVTQAGSVTVTATAPAVEGFAMSTASYTLTVTDTRLAADLAFDPATVNVAVNGEETVGFSKVTTANVTFVVADETIATYDSSTGKIQGLKEGTTTITATSPANDGYLAGEAVCTVVVYVPSSNATFTETEPSINFPATTTYTQAVTTADGYNGTVSYALSENTCGATIEGATVTVTQGGSVTVTATAPAVEGSFSSSTASYTLTVTDTRAAAGLAFDPTTVNVAINGEETVGFSKVTTANVTFEVADQTIATYDSSTGKIQGLKEGTTTITATSPANDGYLAGEAVCTVVVSDPDWIDFTKQGYSDAESITTVNGNNGSVTFGIGSNTNNNDPKWYDSGSAVRLYIGNTITLTAKAGYVITGVVFNVTDGSMSAAGFDDEVTQNGNEFTLVTPSQEIIYSTPSKFRINKVKIFVEEAPAPAPQTVTANIAAACTDGTLCYSTFSCSSAFVVPEDVIVAEIGIEDGKLDVRAYATGDIVPANTGVMISSATAGEKEFTLSSEDGTSVLGAFNALRATGDEGITSDAMATADPNSMYYRLTMHNGTQIGFWWGAPEGAAFSVAANKAYLVVPAAQAARMENFWFADGIITAINSVNVEKGTLNSDAPMYNLAGQRVSKSYKGVVIQNGKKYIVK